MSTNNNVEQILGWFCIYCEKDFDTDKEVDLHLAGDNECARIDKRRKHSRLIEDPNKPNHYYNVYDAGFEPVTADEPGTANEPVTANEPGTADDYYDADDYYNADDYYDEDEISRYEDDDGIEWGSCRCMTCRPWTCRP